MLIIIPQKIIHTPEDNNIQDNSSPSEDQEISRQLKVNLASCKQLGTLSSLQGTKTDFLLDVAGEIVMMDPQATCDLILIGVPDSNSISKASPIVTKAVDNKNDIQKLLWQEDGSFIYSPKVDTLSPDSAENRQFQFIIPVTTVNKEQYTKFTSSNYKLYMLCIQNDALAISTPVLIDNLDESQSLPDYQNIDLKALSQSRNDQGWFLKGNIASFYPNNHNGQIGFLLVKEGVNPYNLVQQAIVDENEWPTKTELFNNGDLIIVPGKYRNIEPNIVGNLLSQEGPMASSNYKVCCYFIKDERHYYLSQMEHFLTDTAASSPAQDSAIPLITFNGNNCRLNISNLKLCRDKIAGKFKNVKLAGGAIEYSSNQQIIPLPADQASYVVFIKPQKGSIDIWRTSIIQYLVTSLCKANTNDSAKGNILVVKDLTKPLSQSAIEFFSKEEAYSCFPCLCSKEDSTFMFYGSQEKLIIEEKEEKEEKTQKDLLEAESPVITLQNKKACIAFRSSPLNSFFDKFSGPFLEEKFKKYATYTFPQVTLSKQDNIQHTGYIIVTSDHKETIKERVKELFRMMPQEKYYVHDSKLDSIFLDKFIDSSYPQIDRHGPTEFSTSLYEKYYKLLGGKETLFVSYWVESPKGEFICSEPVSIMLSKGGKKNK